MASKLCPASVEYRAAQQPRTSTNWHPITEKPLKPFRPPSPPNPLPQPSSCKPLHVKSINSSPPPHVSGPCPSACVEGNGHIAYVNPIVAAPPTTNSGVATTPAINPRTAAIPLAGNRVIHRRKSRTNRTSRRASQCRVARVMYLLSTMITILQPYILLDTIPLFNSRKQLNSLSWSSLNPHLVESAVRPNETFQRPSLLSSTVQSPAILRPRTTTIPFDPFIEVMNTVGTKRNRAANASPAWASALATHVLVGNKVPALHHCHRGSLVAAAPTPETFKPAVICAPPAVTTETPELLVCPPKRPQHAVLEGKLLPSSPADTVNKILSRVSPAPASVLLLETTQPIRHSTTAMSAAVPVLQPKSVSERHSE